MSCYLRRPCHINILPVEILSYIFMLATHSTTSSTSNFKQRYEVPFSPDSVTMPTVLASVHRHWRDIALSTSALWSSLVMSLEQVVRVKAKSDATDGHAHTTFLDVQRLAAHIARSRNCPVDILIDTRDPDWDFEEDGYVAAYSQLIVALIFLHSGTNARTTVQHPPHLPPLFPKSSIFCPRRCTDGVR